MAIGRSGKGDGKFWMEIGIIIMGLSAGRQEIMDP